MEPSQRNVQEGFEGEDSTKEAEHDKSQESSEFVSSVVYQLTVGPMLFVREYPLKIEYDTFVGGHEQRLARSVETQTDDKYINDHIEKLAREIFSKWQAKTDQSVSQSQHPKFRKTNVERQSEKNVQKELDSNQKQDTQQIDLDTDSGQMTMKTEKLDK